MTGGGVVVIGGGSVVADAEAEAELEGPSSGGFGTVDTETDGDGEDDVGPGPGGGGSSPGADDWLGCPDDGLPVGVMVTMPLGPIEIPGDDEAGRVLSRVVPSDRCSTLRDG